jgi:hypothetical protein
LQRSILCWKKGLLWSVILPSARVSIPIFSLSPSYRPETIKPVSVGTPFQNGDGTSDQDPTQIGGIGR